MKKSRIILPAIALLAVSGIASVTGTVAWFTAAQSVTTNVSNIAAINTSGALTAKIAPSTGCQFGEDDVDASGYLSGNSLTFEYLRDVSYDALNDKLAVAVIDSDNGVEEDGQQTITSYAGVTNAKCGTWADKEGPKANTSYDVYYAAEWTTVFSTEAYGTYHLFFDARTKENGGSYLSANTGIAKAFRVAMICGAGDAKETIVWAPYSTTTPISYIAYSSEGETHYAPGDYETTVAYQNSSEHFTTSQNTESQGASGYTHLSGALTKSTPVSVKFVAWFEGTDAACIAANASNVSGVVSALSASLNFYATSWTTEF